MGLKILLLSVFDFAGSGYRICEAVNLNTCNFVEYAVMLPARNFTQFKRYPAIYKIEDNEMKINMDDVERLILLIKDADIIHLKSDYTIDSKTLEIFKIPKSKPVIQTVCGSIFRNLTPDHREGYISNTSFRTSLNPDLNFPEYDGIYTPFSYETTKFKNEWKMREIPIIGHSPSNRDKKGTADFLKACELLKKDGIKFDINLIEGLEHIDCLDEKSESTIFFDQSKVGSYGNSAVEAMAMGIPTTAYLSPIAKENLKTCPVVDCGQTTGSIYKALKGMLKSNLLELSGTTKSWCDSVHSYEVTGKMWERIYKNVYKNSKS